MLYSIKKFYNHRGTGMGRKKKVKKKQPLVIRSSNV